MSNKTATPTYINLPNFSGDAQHFSLNEPLDGAEHVIVSAVDVFGRPETYIFPADKDGNVTDWGELTGSFHGGLDHEEALRGAGYEVAA